MQTTLHFSFPIFESSDKPSWLADWNSTVTKIDNKLYELSIGNAGEQILHDLEEAIAEMNEVVGRVDTINTQVTTLTGNVETLQSVVNGISDTITIINDAIDSLDNRVDGVEATLSTMSTTVSNLQTVVQNLVDNPYELPIASANTLGGIKVGNNLSIDANGVLSAIGGGGGSDDAVKVLTENDFPSEIVIETQYGHQQGRLTLPACPYVEGETTPQEILDYAENPVFWFNPTISNLYVGIYIEGITQQVGGFQGNQFLRPYISIVPIYNQQTQEETRYWSVSYGVAVNVEGSVRNLTYSVHRVFPSGATINAQTISAYSSAGPNSPTGFWVTNDCAIILPDNTTVQVERGKLYLCVYNQTTYKTDIVPVYSNGGNLDGVVKVLTENDFPSEIVIDTQQQGNPRGVLTLPACPYVEGEAVPQELLEYMEDPVFWFTSNYANLTVAVYIEGISQQIGGFSANQFLRPNLSRVSIYNSETQEATYYWTVSYGSAINIDSAVRSLTYASYYVPQEITSLPATSIPAYQMTAPYHPQGFWLTKDCTVVLTDNTTVSVEKGKLYLCEYDMTAGKTSIIPVY